MNQPSVRKFCPVCCDEEKAYTYNHSFTPIEGSSILSDYSIVVCKRCGMIYADTLPGQNNLDDYYANFSKYDNQNTTKDMTDYYQQMIDYVCKKLSDKSSHIADIGCGYGSIIIELKKRGYDNVIGVELSKQNCTRLCNEHNITTINKSLFDLSENDFKIKPNCIILSAVLEHFADLRGAIDILKSLLPDGGLLIITVPYADKFPEYSELPFEEFSMEHINYFSAESLETLLRLSEFKLKDMSEVDYGQQKILVGCFVKKMFNNILQEYVRKCQSHLEPTIALIDKYVNDQTEIVLWGTGTLCQYLLANSNLNQCNIVAIVDGNKSYHGRRLCNSVIQDPSLLCEGGKHENAVIFTLTYRYNDEITKRIREMGLNNRVINIPFDENK